MHAIKRRPPKLVKAESSFDFCTEGAEDKQLKT